MASNFDFLQNRYTTLYEHASHAESLVYTAPRASCFYTRFTLEQAVHWLYSNDPYLAKIEGSCNQGQPWLETIEIYRFQPLSLNDE